ncbi:carboxypeptidase-like regulatory domain-containing protein [Hymenobacter psoromatis]|uniref:carboxypeptidase-like regulatory domain-containing protein n=1 Tax=Hymenobacter psoromatis TaxID=1484116 RepID=UPI001CBA7BCC|nr:carboxypeptidase-like regulatory domain-containing protein [Hymenobacter psoromatis]
MKLTASPFDEATGSLLPVYRDAYLRGDLSHRNTKLVDNYLKINQQRSDATLLHFYHMRQQGELVRPVGWMGQQLKLLRTAPQRFRRRAATLATGALLVGGAAMAAISPSVTGTSKIGPEADLPSGEILAVAPAATASAMRLVTVRGRILDENGRPLVGATVLSKTAGRGVSTDATGSYALVVPAGQAGELQYGYGSYTDELVQLNGHYTQNVTLVPRKYTDISIKRRHRWLFF